MTSSRDPEEYVSKNEDKLVRIIKHSNNTFARALALAALVEYSDTPDVDEVISELKQYKGSQD